MKKLFKAIKKDKYDVTATSEGVTRTEHITTSNPVFEGAKNAREIKARYEAYWGKPHVKVLKVKKTSTEY